MNQRMLYLSRDSATQVQNKTCLRSNTLLFIIQVAFDFRKSYTRLLTSYSTVKVPIKHVFDQDHSAVIMKNRRNYVY